MKTIHPMRVQRLRTNGFRLQESSRSGLPVKYVGRPTKWGNPLKVCGGQIYIDASHRRTELDPWVWYGPGDIGQMLDLYALLWTDHIFENKDLQFWSDEFKKLDIKELADMDLACYCKIEEPCHVDIILEKLYKP